jgi:hypothetical protein
MKLSKKIIAIALAAFMVIAAMPITAFADDLVDVDALATPSFDAKAYHYDAEATGGYSNVVYAVKGESNMSLTGDFSGDNNQAGATYIKLFVPNTTVLVYDGTNKVSSPIVAETKQHDKSFVGKQKICYIASSNGTVYFDRQWNGYHESDWTAWPTETNNHFGYLTSDGRNNEADATNKNTSRFWTNELVYHGSGDTTSYYETFSNITFNAMGYYDNWGDKTGTADFTPTFTNYVINYQPIYDILADARTLAAEINANSSKYTAASVSAAVTALNAVAACNPKNYDFSTDTATEVENCATAIKNAKAAYDAINLVEQHTVTFYDANDDYLTAIVVADGEEIGTLPANTAITSTDNTHHNVYSWGDYTAATVVTDDTNITESVEEVDCSFTAGEHVAATNELNGYTPYTCECGNSYREYDSLETVKAAYTAALDDYNNTVADEDYATLYTAESRAAFAAATVTTLTEVQLADETLAPSVIEAATKSITDALALLVEDLPEDSYNLTLTENIDVNFNLDTEYYEAKDVVKFTVSYIDVTDNKSATRTNFDVELDDLETGAANLTLLAAPAQLAEPYVITPVDGTGAAVGEPIEVSVQDYCKSIINGEYSDEDKAVAQALLNYGALAAEYFDYATTKEDPTYAVQHAGDYKDAVALSDIKTKGAKTPVYSAGVDASGAVINVTGISYVAISEPEFRFYVSQASDVWCSYTDLRIDGDGLSANWIKTEHGNCVSVTGLKASDFAKDFTLHIGGTDLTYNGYTFLYTVLAAETTEENESLQDLAKGIFRYASACQDKFAATV